MPVHDLMMIAAEPYFLGDEAGVLRQNRAQK